MAKVEWDAAKIDSLYEFIRNSFTRLALPASTQLIADMKDRIFVQGKDRRNKLIGSSVEPYSRREMYAKESDFVRKTQSGGRRSAFRPRGMMGDEVHGPDNRIAQVSRIYHLYHGERIRNREHYRTMYVDGWDEVRRLNGRQVGHVDLNYSGSLLSSLKLAQRAKRESATKINDRIDLVIVNEQEIKKSYGLESKYGKQIFLPSDEEIKKQKAFIEKQIAKILKS